MAHLILCLFFLKTKQVRRPVDLITIGFTLNGYVRDSLSGELIIGATLQ
jgi:hypothetical protein